jgi:hypothetical protein
VEISLHPQEFRLLMRGSDTVTIFIANHYNPVVKYEDIFPAGDPGGLPTG